MALHLGLLILKGFWAAGQICLLIGLEWRGRESNWTIKLLFRQAVRPVNHLGSSCFSQQESPKWEKQLCGRAHSRAIQTLSILRGFYYWSRVTVYHQLAVKDYSLSKNISYKSSHRDSGLHRGLARVLVLDKEDQRERLFASLHLWAQTERECICTMQCSSLLLWAVCVSSPPIHRGIGLWLDTENSVAVCIRLSWHCEGSAWADS